MKEKLDALEIVDNKLTKEQIKDLIAEASKLATKKVEEIETAKNKEIEVLNTTIEDLNTKIKDLPQSDDIKALQDKVKEYESAETERKEQEKALALENDMKARYTNVLGDKEFINEYTGDSFYSKFKEQLNAKENKGKGDAEIFEAMTKDVADLFKNPNPGVNTPGAEANANANNNSMINKANSTVSIINEFSRTK